MNEKTEASLSALFNVPSGLDVDVIPEEQSNTSIAVVSPSELVAVEELSPEEIQAREDYEFSRSALKAVATEAQGVLHRASDVAHQTDTPRAFEAVAVLLKATIETHQALQELHSTAAANRLAAKSTTNTPNVNVEKGVIFAGTTDELLRLIDPTRT